MKHRLCIIGGGNMGSAIVRGCISSAVLQPDELIVAEIDDQRRNAIERLGVATTSDVSQCAASEQIMLAVKPQSFAALARELAPRCSAQTIIISIMAGLRSTVIRKSLAATPRIIRAMPNLPCQIGEGITAIALGEGASKGDESLAVSIFNALGRTVMVDESLMYAVTAVSGSGPAYIFLLAEAMEAAAVSLGIDAPTAQLLVTHTVRGSASLLQQSSHSASKLRESVTSPGGTTAAALAVFQQREFIQIVIDALTAARDRGMQLDQT